MSKYDNRNPRSTQTIEAIKTHLSPEAYARYERAESAHKNNMENMPLYIAAVFAGLLAEQSAKGTISEVLVSHNAPTGLTKFVYSWFVLRLLYNMLYINTSQQKWTHFRSMTWMAGFSLCIGQIYMAANVLGN